LKSKKKNQKSVWNVLSVWQNGHKHIHIQLEESKRLPCNRYENETLYEDTMVDNIPNYFERVRKIPKKRVKRLRKKERIIVELICEAEKAFI
jgi:hypothetical protein